MVVNNTDLKLFMNTEENHCWIGMSNTYFFNLPPIQPKFTDLDLSGSLFERIRT